MKYKKKLWYLVAFLLLLLPFSCEKDDFSNEKGSENESSLPVVAEARTYFEDYASIAMETEPMGLHPGNIAPEWEKAKVMVQSTSVCVNVPLITEATYEGSFGVETDTMQTVSKETYYTAILQKLIVVKDLESKAFSCYIVTIIPSEENATKNNANIDKMFYAGDLETKFSGTIIYSTVTTNYTIAVEKYNKGERLEDVSLFNAGKSYTADLEEMSVLIGASHIKRKVRAMTRGDEFGSGGYMLPEVIVIGHQPTPTPPPPSLPPPPDPPSPFPPYTPPPYMPPVPPPSSGSSHGGGSGEGEQYPLKLISPAPEYDEVTKKINEVLISIYKKFKEMGIDLNEYKIKIAVSCTTNARKEEDGTIGLCASFVTKGYGLNDQISIIWHEVYHLKNDKDCSMILEKLPSPITYSDIPVYIENYIKNDLYGEKIPDRTYIDEITISHIKSPEYYKNEIATYQAEMNNGINVSPAYAQERNYLYWKHQQDLKISEQYYNK